MDEQKIRDITYTIPVFFNPSLLQALEALNSDSFIIKGRITSLSGMWN